MYTIEGLEVATFIKSSNDRHDVICKAVKTLGKAVACEKSKLRFKLFSCPLLLCISE